MYTVKDFPTKKALIAAFKAGETIEVYQPNGDLFGTGPYNGRVSLEGPHYPKPHSWYASAEVVDSVVKKVK